jgi:tetratricopeptide (TPR) repeat protein
VPKNAAVLNKQKPAMILKKSNIKKVELTRYNEKWFKLEIDLVGNYADELEKITSGNIGKRIAFVKGTKILLMPFVSGAVTKPVIVLEFSSGEQDAKNIAGNFDKSYIFIDKRPFISTDVKKVFELRDKREYDEAIKILKSTLNKTDNNEEKVYLYIALWTCYWTKKDYGNAAKAYQLLVKQPIAIDLTNYNTITQAYSYLIGFENKHGNTKKANDYAKKSIDIFKYIIKNYPLTIAAQSANLGIGGFELQNGNVKEAEKRALLAIRGDMKTFGYLLLGACYEYQDKFKDAEKIYEKLIKDFPNSGTSLVAQEYLDSLKHNKSKVKEDIKKFKHGVLVPD